MPDTVQGKLEVQDTAGTVTTITADGDEGSATLGASDRHGTLTLQSATGEDRVYAKAAGGQLVLLNDEGEWVFFVSADSGMMTLGADGRFARFRMKEENGEYTVDLNAGHGEFRFGGNGRRGKLALYPANQSNVGFSGATVVLDGAEGNVFLGGSGADGDIVCLSIDGQNRVHLDAHDGNIHLGGNGADGDLFVYPNGGTNGAQADTTIHLDGDQGNIHLGGNGFDGDLLVYPSKGTNGAFDDATIHIDGDAGDITLKNADCAEEFDVVGAERVEAGSVMALDADGRLRISGKAYDRRVAGVISGAGDYKPGLVLDKQGDRPGRLPVAVMGKVWCKAVGPIEAGDLLTSSDTAGHAMRAEDPARAFGAVLGKALRPLGEGAGLVPVLVALQ